ncbi:MAG: efflux RND transporter periplasmic adaptor subunit [Gemmatimonadaceae bacterium]|nr:efflux RND transporter periplasmic adaptor subunit [Gemmatimonadaceae bacterium]
MPTITFRPTALLLASAALLAACRPGDTPPAEAATAVTPPATAIATDTTLTDALVLPGTATAIREATLSTKLMASVSAVLVSEGARVSAGQPLVELDARDIAAKAEQADAGVRAADAAQREAAQYAERIRGLFADSAATPAQRDAAEAGLARANAAAAQARGAARELGTLAAYSRVTAPFPGTIVRRHVDPGAFAAPGAPLLTIQDDAQLRIRVDAPLDAARGLARGATVDVTVGGAVLTATIEAVIPSGGNVYTINAIVPNGGRQLMAGSPATVAVPRGTRRGLAVPTKALTRDGDLVGVTIRQNGQSIRRWVRTGATSGAYTEITAGLVAGDVIVVPETN